MARKAQKLCCVCLPCSSHAALPGRAQVSALVPEIQATAMSSPEVSLISVWVSLWLTSPTVMYYTCIQELLLSLNNIIVDWGEIAIFIWNCAWDYFNGFCRDLIFPILCLPFSISCLPLSSHLCHALLWDVPGFPQPHCGVGSSAVSPAAWSTWQSLPGRAQALGALAWHCWFAQSEALAVQGELLWFPGLFPEA